MSNEKILLVFEQEYQLVKMEDAPNQTEPSVKEVEYNKWVAEYFSFEDADADLRQLVKDRQEYWQKRRVFTRIFRASTTPV